MAKESSTSSGHEQDNQARRFSRADYDRLARKAALAAKGTRELSEESASAAVHVVLGYQEQYAEDKRRAGRTAKFKAGIRLATETLIRQHPTATACEIWKYFPNIELDDMRWDFYIDGEKLVQVDGRTNKENAITFETFRKEYYSKVKKSMFHGD